MWQEWNWLAGKVLPGAMLKELCGGRSAGNLSYFHILLILCEQPWQMVMGASETPDPCVCTNFK